MQPLTFGLSSLVKNMLSPLSVSSCAAHWAPKIYTIHRKSQVKLHIEVRLGIFIEAHQFMAQTAINWEI